MPLRDAQIRSGGCSLFVPLCITNFVKSGSYPPCLTQQLLASSLATANVYVSAGSVKRIEKLAAKRTGVQLAEAVAKRSEFSWAQFICLWAPFYMSAHR